MSPTLTPTRSPEQRLVALRHANQVRLARARLKHAIRDGDHDLAVLLVRDPTPVVASMKVEDLLLVVPKLGPVKVTRLLHRCAVARSKTLGGLTHRQRDALSRELGR